MCQRGNWIINLFLLFCNFNTLFCELCEKCNNNSNPYLPEDWPCSWNDGIIPFVFDFFTVSPLKLMNIVQKGHEFIQERSCLHFREHDPVALARQTNITYLYYTFSEVLESCCLKFYNKPRGRRLVLITPLCKLPAQAGHATLHAMGLHHEKKFGFRDNEAKAVMFPDKCAQRIDALKIFEETLDDLSLQIHSNGR